VLLLDNEGMEQVRLEGYLPNGDFLAAVASGLVRIAFAGQPRQGMGARWLAIKPPATILFWAKLPSSVWTAKAVPWLSTQSKKEGT